MVDSRPTRGRWWREGLVSGGPVSDMVTSQDLGCCCVDPFSFDKHTSEILIFPGCDRCTLQFSLSTRYDEAAQNDTESQDTYIAFLPYSSVRGVRRVFGSHTSWEQVSAMVSLCRDLLFSSGHLRIHRRKEKNPRQYASSRRN